MLQCTAALLGESAIIRCVPVKLSLLLRAKAAAQESERVSVEAVVVAVNKDYKQSKTKQSKT
jgi:hypothetical protein